MRLALRFTVEYQDENQQIHVYRETIYVTIAEAESEEIGPTFHLNQHENQASTTGVLLHDTKGDLAEQSPCSYHHPPVPCPPQKKYSNIMACQPLPLRKKLLRPYR